MRILHIGHLWGGGLTKWLHEFMEASSHTNFLLTLDDIKDATRATYRLRDSTGRILRAFNPNKPIHRILPPDTSLLDQVDAIRRDFAIDTLLVSGIFGFSWQVLSLPFRRTGVVFHDQSPVCAGTHGFFKQVCTHCSSADLRSCVAENPYSLPFKNMSSITFESIRQDFLRFSKHSFLFAPSRAAQKQAQLISPELLQRNFHIIPHGLKLTFPSCFGGASIHRKLRLIHLGRVSDPKGAQALGYALPLLTEIFDFHFLGYGNELPEKIRQISRTSIEQYKGSDLPSLLEQVKPDLGLILSEVPETFCYAFSELHAAQIPVIASNRGALAERMPPRTGMLIEPTGEALVESLKTCAQRPHSLVEMHLRIPRYSQMTIHEMVGRYEAVLTMTPNDTSGPFP